MENNNIASPSNQIHPLDGRGLKVKREPLPFLFTLRAMGFQRFFFML
jgi:hypothetical protein